MSNPRRQAAGRVVIVASLSTAATIATIMLTLPLLAAPTSHPALPTVYTTVTHETRIAADASWIHQPGRQLAAGAALGTIGMAGLAVGCAYRPRRHN